VGKPQGQGIDTLNAVQVETLRHVLAHRNSKEIGRIMGVSPHTVDARIKASIRALGVNSRQEAARIIAAAGIEAEYQPLIYQSPELAAASRSAQGGLVSDESGASGFFHLGAPFPTSERPYNMHGLRERILWPILIALGTIMAFAALYSVLLGLGAMLS
jgi:DNA-binding CsgD family transcriptional regulator